DRTVTGVQTCALPIYHGRREPRLADGGGPHPSVGRGHGLPGRSGTGGAGGLLAGGTPTGGGRRRLCAAALPDIGAPGCWRDGARSEERRVGKEGRWLE